MQTLNEITSLFIFLPTIIGIFLYKKLSKEFQLLTIYLIIFSLLESTSFTIAIIGNRINTAFLLHIFIPLEMALLSWIFHIHFRTWLPKYLIPILIITFIFASTLNSMYLQPITTFNTYARYTEAIILIIFSILYLYKVFTEAKIERITHEGFFWFSVAILIYFAGTFWLYIGSNYLLNMDRLQYRFLSFLIFSVCHLMMYLTLSLAIWKRQ